MVSQIEIAEIVLDLDQRFPDVGSLNTAQLQQYFGVSRPTADAWMKANAKLIGDRRIPKILLAKWLVNKRS